MDAATLKGFRTIIFNLISLAYIYLNSKYPNFVPAFDDQTLNLLAVAVGNIILRAITSTPVGKKEVAPNEPPSILGNSGQVSPTALNWMAAIASLIILGFLAIGYGV